MNHTGDEINDRIGEHQSNERLLLFFLGATVQIDFEYSNDVYYKPHGKCR